MTLSTTDAKPLPSDVMHLQMAAYSPVADTEKVDRKGWVSFGDDNLFPMYLRELSQTSPTHGALIKAIGDMIAGKGVSSEQYQSELDALYIDTVVYGCAHDYKLHGGFYIEVIWSNDRSVISKINHIPFEECRIAVDQDDESEVGVYHSPDWSNLRKKKNAPAFIPKFNPLTKMEHPVQVYWCFTYTGSQIYPRPDYWSAVNAIETDRLISIFQCNLLSNGMFPSTVVNFYNGQATPEQKMALMRDWENKLTGASNAAKVMFFFNEREAQKTEIEAFPISDLDKQFDMINSQTQEKIITAHRIVTPLLVGLRSGTGFGSNKDEMATGLEILTNQVIEPAQRKISDALVYILGEQMPNLAFNIKPNTPLTTQQATAATIDSGATDVAATALNGAQITSLVDIVMQAASDMLPVSSAKAVVRAAFPTLSTAQVDEIFKDVQPGSIAPSQIQQSLYKKKVDEAFDDDAVADALIELGEDAQDDWVLIDEYEVDYEHDDEDDARIMSHNFVSTGSARPNAKSEQDKTIDQVKFYTRYKYDGKINANTRKFCIKMLDADKLYRKEDIMQMGSKIVNEGWGPRGADTYSIWLYKGGGNCHHVWKKQVYASAKGFGLDLSNPDVKQALDVRVKKAGYKTRNNPKVAQRPIDMPYNGFLPDNPRFGK
jgi:hypothetical protein